MKRVTAFVGSARKGNTHQAVTQFLAKLQDLGDLEAEIVALSDYTLKPCRGCQVCFEVGEELCPLKDDRDVLMAKVADSDGIIWASPNYCGDVSGMMKVFIDRFGFACHRPRYFGKVCTSIVAQGIAAGDRIVAYLDTVGMSLGFNVVEGTCVTLPGSGTEAARRKIDRAFSRQAQQFYAGLVEPAYPAPSWTMLMVFRMARSSIQEAHDEDSRDYQYYTEKGWFEADYYYPAHLGLPKTAAGKLIDALAPALRNVLA